MPRPGTEKAKELLSDIARKHEVSMKSLILYRRRNPQITKAKREFCIEARFNLKLAIPHIAEIINLNPSTVVYHYDKNLRERKNNKRLAKIGKHNAQSNVQTMRSMPLRSDKGRQR